MPPNRLSARSISPTRHRARCDTRRLPWRISQCRTTREGADGRGAGIVSGHGTLSPSRASLPGRTPAGREVSGQRRSSGEADGDGPASAARLATGPRQTRGGRRKRLSAAGRGTRDNDQDTAAAVRRLLSRVGNQTTPAGRERTAA